MALWTPPTLNDFSMNKHAPSKGGEYVEMMGLKGKNTGRRSSPQPLAGIKSLANRRMSKAGLEK